MKNWSFFILLLIYSFSFSTAASAGSSTLGLSFLGLSSAFFTGAFFTGFTGTAFTGCKHHHHLATFHFRKLLYHCYNLLNLSSTRLSKAKPNSWWKVISRPLKRNVHFTLSPSLKKRVMFTYFNLVIALIRSRAKLNFFNLNLLLFKLLLVQTLAFSIFKFTVIH